MKTAPAEPLTRLRGAGARSTAVLLSLIGPPDHVRALASRDDRCSPLASLRCALLSPTVTSDPGVSLFVGLGTPYATTPGSA